MKYYYFYANHDEDKEPIGIILAESKEIAISLFSRMKYLEEELFLGIYNVELQSN